MTLEKYQKKRSFSVTPEPKGKVAKHQGSPIFVVQKHQATNLHYDFRLEHEGVLVSWAVPKGPPDAPGEKRLAVHVEDHPLEYAKFKGTIPEGEYGAGSVEIWDHGTFETVMWQEDHITVILSGSKLKGEYALVKTHFGKNSWLMIKADKQASRGDKIEPMLATLIDEPFDKEGWFYEVKWDGYRAIAEVSGGKVELYSRNGISFNDRFSEIAESLAKIGHDAVLDGEVVVVDSKGISHFQALQDYIKSHTGNLVYYLFDILRFDGKNLEHLPLKVRLEYLSKIKLPGNVKISEHIENRGKDFYIAAEKQGLEGIIAKDSESTYKEGVRGRDWLKIKTHMEQEAVIGGFTKPRGARQKFGALVLGVYDKGKLRYIGHTGGGFDEKTLNEIYEKLKPLAQKKSSFDPVPKTNEEVTWVAPKLVAQIKFEEWTREGLTRQPIFLGLREDKKAYDVKMEKGVTMKESKITKDETVLEINKIKLSVTHLNKIFWPGEKFTKGDLINYYREISPFILPYLKDRPESLKRYPNGITGGSFFEKNVVDHPKWIKTIPIKSESQGKDAHYVICNDEATLIYLINLGCIDLNPWSSRIGSLDKPDFAIMDLDPEETSFENVIKTAQTVHEVLDNADVKSYPKNFRSDGNSYFNSLGSQILI